jgi:cytochrome b involved in lipid metabolism
MAISGNVYDVTSFIPNHPGGDQILMGCGKDATSLFTGQGHSGRAYNILPQYQIGVLAK